MNWARKQTKQGKGEHRAEGAWIAYISPDLSCAFKAQHVREYRSEDHHKSQGPHNTLRPGMRLQRYELRDTGGIGLLGQFGRRDDAETMTLCTKRTVLRWANLSQYDADKPHH